jgi:hypothetical protein
MEQPISRRGILTLAGGSLAGAAAGAGAVGPAAADSPLTPRVAVERAYRPLAHVRSGGARIQHVEPGTTGLTTVEAALSSRSIDEDQELVVFVRAAVPADRLGRRRVLRTIIVGDNGDLRMETVGPEVRLEHTQFELEITLDRGHPLRDWNLIRERIFAVRVTLNILDTADFAVSDDYLFKVRRR